MANHTPPGRIWEFVHEDYDGPEDPRCGWATTLHEAVEALVEMIEEGFFELDLGGER